MHAARRSVPSCSIAWLAGSPFAVAAESVRSGRPTDSRILTVMPRRHDQRDLSAAAQEYLLALRVLVGSDDAARVTAAQVARHLGVTTQAASEMFRRLVADGLVAHAEGRDLHLTPAGRDIGGRDLPPARAARVAPDLGHRPRLGGVG